MTRVALIHALADSVAPINAALAASWPQAQRMNLLDDSLSADLARAGALDRALHERFNALARYAIGTGAQGILFTCSAFGPCIEEVARAWPAIPVLKPNEAMIDEVAAFAADGAPVGLVATFAPTLASMPAEFPREVRLVTALAEGALARLQAGDARGHDEIVVAAARNLLAQGCKAIALAQFSLARAAPAVADALHVTVFTTVDSAVRRLRARVEANARA